MSSRSLVAPGRVIELASEAERQLRTFAQGKPAEAPTQSNAGSMTALADLLASLVRDVGESRAHARRMRSSLERIAHLRLRGAQALMERGDWKMISAEMQVIAQETITALDRQPM